MHWGVGYLCSPEPAAECWAGAEGGIFLYLLVPSLRENFPAGNLGYGGVT